MPDGGRGGPGPGADRDLQLVRLVLGAARRLGLGRPGLPAVTGAAQFAGALVGPGRAVTGVVHGHHEQPGDPPFLIP